MRPIPSSVRSFVARTSILEPCYPSEVLDIVLLSISTTVP